MLLVRKNQNLFPGIPSLFNDDWFNNTLPFYPERKLPVPAVNIKENEKEFEIEVAAPGMSKENFNVELDKNILTISSHKEEKKEEKNNNENYYCREFNSQSFQRSFNLGENLVNSEKILAKYIDGILHVKLSKREELKPKPAKQISIS
ncbi:MAG: Hsp20/alpha crystallin family protein [Bacteroidales bacterium]|nr:Hsp20/alpha crystallin family protein [Bacteroidales bacterium]